MAGTSYVAVQGPPNPRSAPKPEVAIGFAAMMRTTAPVVIAAHSIRAALTGPELLILVSAGVAAWFLLRRRQTSTESTLPEESTQAPLYTERCGAPGKGRVTFQRLAMYDHGMVLAQDGAPAFLPYSGLIEAWREHLGAWSHVRIRLGDDMRPRRLKISSDKLLSFASREPDRVLEILRAKGVKVRA